MKKTLIDKLPDNIPIDLRSLMFGYPVYDSSCSSEACVYFVERDGGYYVKQAPKGSLATEAEMTRYFHSLGLGVEVARYISEENDWLVTKAAVGEDCTSKRFLDDPRRLAILLGESLRSLHEIDHTKCPLQNRMDSYDATVRANYKKGIFDSDLFAGEFRFDNREGAYAEYLAARDSLDDHVLLHGDYCLPNIILENWRLSAFIDVGNGGVGDRHIDLFWGVWTLWFNLKTDAYKDVFLDAYGRDKVEVSLLRAIAAAETFG